LKAFRLVEEHFEAFRLFQMRLEASMLLQEHLEAFRSFSDSLKSILKVLDCF